MSVSIFGAWAITLGFFCAVFVVGLYIQHREKQDRINRKVSDAIHQDLVREAMLKAMGASKAATENPSIFGTLYGRATDYERLLRQGK